MPLRTRLVYLRTAASFLYIPLTPLPRKNMSSISSSSSPTSQGRPDLPSILPLCSADTGLAHKPHPYSKVHALDAEHALYAEEAPRADMMSLRRRAVRGVSSSSATWTQHPRFSRKQFKPYIYHKASAKLPTVHGFTPIIPRQVTTVTPLATISARRQGDNLGMSSSRRRRAYRSSTAVLPPKIARKHDRFD